MKKKLNNNFFFQEIIIVQKVKKIIKNKGNIHKFIDIKSPLFKSFGEIYFWGRRSDRFWYFLGPSPGKEKRDENGKRYKQKRYKQK